MIDPVFKCYSLEEMGYSLSYRIQKLEYTKLKKTEFFPVLSDRLTEICVGTKSRNLGDALILTPLFSKLAEHRPHLKVSGFIRAFNSVVLEHHPLSIPILRGPSALYGDDLNLGSGHMIEQKLRAFGLPFTENEIRPQIFLSEAEKESARKTLLALFGNGKEPLWVLHPWGKTWNSLVSGETWESWIRNLPKGSRVLQVGMKGESELRGAKFFAIDPSTHRSARELFAVVNEASYFLGVDSGPMHVAAAFQIPAMILVKSSEVGALARGMEFRKTLPYFHPLVRHFSNLYDSQAQVEVNDLFFSNRVLEWIAKQK